MILEIFAIFDDKAKAFMTPFFMHNQAMASRTFKHTVNDPSHQFSRSPEDFNLFCLGTFDDSSGKLEAKQELLFNGLQLKE